MISSFNLATLFDFVTYGAETKIMQNFTFPIINKFSILLPFFTQIIWKLLFFKS